MSRFGDKSGVLNHTPVLAAARDRPVARSALQAELDVSRATVYRQTNALVEDGLLERTREGYRTTSVGRAVADTVEQFEETLAAIDELEPLVDAIGAPELTRNVDTLAGGTVSVATPQNPNEPIDLWLEHFSSVDRFRGLVTAGCPPEITQQGVEHARRGVDFEVICSPQALEVDRNASEEAVEAIASAEAPSLYTHPGVPFTVGVTDDVVLVVGFDDETALPVASVATDDPAAREWVEALYRRYKAGAAPLETLEANSIA